MPANDFIIRYCQPNGSWQEFQPVREEIVIGRAPDCDLILDFREISRHHARFTINPEGLLITDLGATNATQLNGAPLAPRQPTPLTFGDVVTVGAVLLELARPGTTPEQAAPCLSEAGAEDGQHTVVADGAIRTAEQLYQLDFNQYEKITLGRAGDNTVVLDHPLVSRYHAELERIGARIQIRDLHSTNGVFVNNQRLEGEVWLKDNDRVQVGPYQFVLSGLRFRQRIDTGLELVTANIRKMVAKKVNLLQEITLRIKPMEFVAVVGMSGSGKTTLLNTLSGYSPATDGRVTVNGIDLYKHYDLFRNDIGYVPQKDIVHTELTPRTALDYVARLRMPADSNPQERAQAVADVLSDLDLTERAEVPISRLSGGQLKRVSIGVELLTKPRLFFLDEPTSGLDPGTEYEMMRLMRKLADQGRTVILVTHATKNVMLCDKVIFLARGGHVAFFGAPDEALIYFDQFRTLRERQQKQMEFDDIYRILNDEKRGSPAEWGERFKATPQYLEVAAYASASPSQPPSTPVAAGRGKGRQVSAFRQFVILSARNLKIMAQDKVSLALMLLLAPAIGLLDFIWGTKLYDPVEGNAINIVTMWYMTAIVTILVGSLSSVREIVKEVDIYRRERAVNLKILPYILSKIWVGVVLAFYQAGALMLTRLLLNRPVFSGPSAYLALYITLFLCILCGYLIGLVISASATNQNAAMIMIIGVLVPQFLFAGVMLPLDLIPGGMAISTIMPTRWGVEAFLNISAMGNQLINDKCWALPDVERDALSEAQKADCNCTGINIFTRCADFPGILSSDYYDSRAQQVIAQDSPRQPEQPTAYPYPTALPSPTPLATLTPIPQPANPAQLNTYLDQRADQAKEYQDSITGQFDEYSQQMQQQGEDYSTLRSQQGDAYKAEMEAYTQEKADYQEDRQRAISNAESRLEKIYNDHGRSFRGTVVQRWAYLGIQMAVLIGLLVFFQKRKDVV